MESAARGAGRLTPGTATHDEARAHERVRAILAARADVVWMLGAVERLDVPDAWIGAGLIRGAVWDALCGLDPAPPGDVDVVYFDPHAPCPAADAVLEARLRALGRRAAIPRRDTQRSWAGAVPWSVRNQARMHTRNGHASYADMADALWHWPETATAVAARSRAGRIELLAPHGLADLLALVVRPGPAYARRPEVVRRRAHEKGWMRRWPGLTLP